jgi:hypothetical protein
MESESLALFFCANQHTKYVWYRSHGYLLLNIENIKKTQIKLKKVPAVIFFQDVQSI